MNVCSPCRTLPDAETIHFRLGLEPGQNPSNSFFEQPYSGLPNVPKFPSLPIVPYWDLHNYLYNHPILFLTFITTWLHFIFFLLLLSTFSCFPWAHNKECAHESLPQSSVSSVQLLSHVQLFATPWTAACQSSLSFTISQSLLKLMSIESVMPSNHFIFCCPLLLLLPIPPRSFPVSQFFASGGQSIGASAEASVLPMNIQD